ncbi:PASTA domain-containing protein [Microbacterium sp. AZCO]|uniref:PASTA domain-containing protein n=1 Tax=Microbacterium sp. AZCO TaxID=3142976 RepID=UPI0031F47934
MAASRPRLVGIALVLLILLAPSLVAARTVPLASVSETVEVPDLVGERLDLALKSVKALDLKAKVHTGGRSVWVKKNWVVVEQTPVGGKVVKPGTKVTLHVIKKSEVVGEGTALGACRAWAKSDPELAYGIEFPAFKFVSAKQDLGWAIDADAWVITSSDDKVAARVYCEIAGTNKRPTVEKYEVTVR